MPENYAVVQNDVVINVIVWDGVTPFNVPAGQTLVRLGDSGAWIGWSYADGVFTAPAG